MKLESVHAENLLSHKNTTLSFTNERTQIAGSNGAGKTSIAVDTLLWVLFGQARGATTDQLKGPWEKGMKASVTFIQGGKRYSVTRERGSGSSLSLFNNSDNVDMTEKHVAMTQAKIIDLVGSENAFTNTVIFKQGDGLKFALMTPSERKRLIDELTGIEEFSEIESRSRKASRAAEAERSRLQTEADRLRNAEVEVHQLQEQLSDIDSKIAVLSAAIVTADTDLSTADKMLNQLQDEHEQRTKLEGEVHAAEMAWMRSDSAATSATEFSKNTERQLSELLLGTTCPTCGAKLDPDHPNLRTKIEYFTKQLEKSRKDEKEAKEKVEVAFKELERLKKNASKANDTIKKNWDDAQALKKSASTKRSGLISEHTTLELQSSQVKGRIEVLSRDLPKLSGIESELETQKKRIKGFDLITEAFSKRGIPRELTRGFVGEIEKGANALLAGLSPMTVRLSLEKEGTTKSGVTEGTMDVWVKDIAGERKVEMLSGGEKMRIMLAIRLSTAQAMAKKHDRSLKTLILDESLDGLDQAGKDSALTMIQSLSHFERLLMITHDSSVAGFFPELITLVKSSDGSSAVI